MSEKADLKNNEAVVTDEVKKVVNELVTTVSEDLLNLASSGSGSAKDTEIADLTIAEKDINEVVEAIKVILGGKQLSSYNIFQVVAGTMSVTKRMKKLPNHTKKKVLLAGLHRYIQESSLDSGVKSVLNVLVNTVADHAIDVLSDVAKGKHDLSGSSCCTII